MKRASGSSRRVQVINTSQVDLKSSVLTHKALQGQKKINVNRGWEHLQQMSEEELELHNQQVMDAQNTMVVDQDIEMQYNEVLLGRLPLDISNAGGKMAAVAEVIKHKRCHTDRRTRRDHTENQNRAFRLQQ
ncbi:hypothetical protein FIBSPDRAFT_963788 [Athelia psychrophila]|uniref:Uncharacterized protein n=1 Tax=Athelia psychrophila TaxID=1759441 RepID=A0A165YKT4_9AGAM|nr:hypothetical protein FIBSPDRAFT_963788 [Fibularhizoctonia sp. CBS 109695]